jgi:signal peptidase
MRAIRLLGNAILWLIALVGVLSMLVFGATKLGYLKPLVVISGSMEPKIMTGDLVFDTPHKTSELEVGDVASIPSAVTGKLISHRVVKVVAKDGHYEVNLKGDANENADAETYVVGPTVWRPVVQVSGGGYVVTKLAQRNVAIPLGVTLLALLGLALVPSDGGRTRRSPGVEQGPALLAPGPATTGDHTVTDKANAADEPFFPDRIADLTSAHR